MMTRSFLSRGSSLFALAALAVLSTACNEAPASSAAEGPEPEAVQEAAPDPSVFVVVTSADNMTQGMAMVLANQSLDQEAEVRVLLCGAGANLGLAEHDGQALEPRDVTPGQLLDRLITNDVQVDVCAIFLPNTQWSEDDLRTGVGVAQPPEVASFMLEPGVRYFTF